MGRGGVVPLEEAAGGEVSGACCSIAVDNLGLEQRIGIFGVP